jgi:hypothetical protein
MLIDRFVDKDPTKNSSPACSRQKKKHQTQTPAKLCKFHLSGISKSKRKTYSKKRNRYIYRLPLFKIYPSWGVFLHLFGFSLILQTALILSVGIPGCEESGCMLVVFVNGDGRVKMCQQ